MRTSSTPTSTIASLVAEYLVAQGVPRVYGLCGGHIQPLWDALAQADISIVDTRHEAGAVFMAHAEAELCGGLGVALVTAGPGLTNAVTPIANASVARSSVLVLSGRSPRPQSGGGAMQDVPQAAIVAPLCRRVESVGDQTNALGRLDAAVGAALGDYGPGGPAYVEFPTDLLDEPVRAADVHRRWLHPRTVSRISPADDAITEAVDAVARSTRPLVIGGRGTTAARQHLDALLTRTGAVYIDTGESRGALDDDHPSNVAAMRARVMREADLVITLGRRLDFQLAYGSTAVFNPDATLMRIGRTPDELTETRRADVAVRGDVAEVLQRLSAAVGRPADLDEEWIADVRAQHRQRSVRLGETMAAAPAGDDGRMHPFTLINAVNRFIDEESIVIADGGDILSFARVGLRTTTYLDCGPFGCLGVGVPFATAAALSCPGRRVVALIGDGSIGYTATDLHTAARHGARAVFVVANNNAWNIERMDQLSRYDGRLIGVELPGCRSISSPGVSASTASMSRTPPHWCRRWPERSTGLPPWSTWRSPATPSPRTSRAASPACRRARRYARGTRPSATCGREPVAAARRRLYGNDVRRKLSGGS